MKLALIVVQDGKPVAEHVVSSGEKTKLIKVKPGQNFVLVDQATGKAPQNIKVARKGNKLSLINSTDPANAVLMELEEFYVAEGASPSIVGIAEDGVYYHYVSVDGVQGGLIAKLTDGASAQIALNGQAIGLVGGSTSTAAMSIDAWLPQALLVGAGLLVGNSLLSGSNGSGSAVVQPNPAPSGPQLTNPSGGTSTGTNDTTPSINVGKIPNGYTP